MQIKNYILEFLKEMYGSDYVSCDKDSIYVDVEDSSVGYRIDISITT